MLSRVKNRNLDVLFLFLVTSLIFIVLYNKFIFRDFAYMYSVPGDFGSDTINTYYPPYVYFSQMVHSLDFDMFTLHSGLGISFLYQIGAFFNPFDLFVILFPTDIIDIGILISTYFKVLIIMLFSFKFFKLLLKRRYSMILSSLLWTFSSYIIIWGQHYQFCTAMVDFTIFIYLIQKWLLGDKNAWKYLILIECLFLLNNYFFFYISGLFTVIYIVFFQWIKNISVRIIINQLLQLFLLTILSIGIGMLLFIPIIESFVNSTRTSSLSTNLYEYLKPYETKVFMTMLARFLNSNLLGGAFQPVYSGFSNYYEASFLFVSMLTAPAILYQVTFTECKKKKVIAVLFCLLALSFPIFTYILGFNAYSQRWTFVLIFLMCLCIGYLLDVISERMSTSFLYKIGIIYLVIMVLIIYLVCSFGDFQISMTELKLSFIFILAYTICFFMPLRYRKMILSFLIVLELIAMNYRSINYRGIEYRSDFLSRYQDGTTDALNILKEKDSSLYRVSKNYMSVFLNDSLAQGYNGFDSYSSVNTKSLWNLASNYNGIYNGHPNYVHFKDPIFKTLMGSKYILSKYELIDYPLISKGESVYIYENPNYMTFGYLYDWQLSSDQFERLSENDKIIALTQGVIYNQSILPIKNNIDLSKTEDSILKKLRSSANCDYKVNSDSIEIYGKSDDMQLFFTFDDPKVANEIEITIESETSTQLQVFLYDGIAYTEENSIYAHVEKGMNTVRIPVANDFALHEIRLDPSSIKQDMVITNIKLISNDQVQLTENLEHLKKNGTVEANFADSTYTAKVVNNKEQSTILMVPITFSENWKATIDSDYTKVIEINNGVIGIEIPHGVHYVNLSYHYPKFGFGILISSMSIALYIYLLNDNRRHRMISFIKQHIEKRRI